MRTKVLPEEGQELWRGRVIGHRGRRLRLLRQECLCIQVQASLSTLQQMTHTKATCTDTATLRCSKAESPSSLAGLMCIPVRHCSFQKQSRPASPGTTRSQCRRAGALPARRSQARRPARAHGTWHPPCAERASCGPSSAGPGSSPCMPHMARRPLLSVSQHASPITHTVHCR